MTANKLYTIDDFWFDKLKRKIKSFYQTIYWCPRFFAVINILFSVSMVNGSKINFWLLYIPLTIVTTVFCIVAPRKAIARYKTIVRELKLTNEGALNLTLVDNATLALTEYEIRDDVFQVGKIEEPCKHIFNKSDDTSFIVITGYFPINPEF